MNKPIKKIKVIPCEVFTRVVGFYRPVSQFNKGQKAQFNNRKNFRVDHDKIKSIKS
jgi:hypothetical protein